MLITTKAVLQFAGILLAITSIVEPCSAEVKSQQVDYHGWSKAFRLTNGTVELVYVPQIGRIMRYGYVNSSNILWENPALAGMEPDKAKAGKEWQNFGGDKVWPAPQSVWNWPPDFGLDPGEYSASIVEGTTIEISSKPSPTYGIRISRKILMDASGTGVTVKNTISNDSAKDCKWSVWEVAQVDSPDVAIIPAGKDGKFVKLSGETLPTGALTNVGDQLHLTRDQKQPAKIGSTHPGKWAAMEKHGLRFKIQMVVTAPRSAEYPDSGCLQELYTNPDPLRYVELELLGPILTIAPGKSIEMTTKWSIGK